MIYILEDNLEIRELELYTLKNSGYEAVGFTSGAKLYEAMQQNIPELVILDIMLPDASGLDVLKKLRTSNDTKDIPVILVTAKTTEADKVKGFDYGADDYISKPFSLIEFLARVRAVLRRSSTVNVQEQTVSLGNISLNPVNRIVTVDDKPCELTFKEFELLHLMIKHPDRVFTRDILMDKVWGLEYFGESRTVDMHIKTLRRKLGSSGKMIHTVRNVGYRISL